MSSISGYSEVTQVVEIPDGIDVCQGNDKRQEGNDGTVEVPPRGSIFQENQVGGDPDRTRGVKES